VVEESAQMKLAYQYMKYCRICEFVNDRWAVQIIFWFDHDELIDHLMFDFACLGEGRI